MEELLVYAMLYCEGFEVESLYQSKLDELFLENSEDELLLELENHPRYRTSSYGRYRKACPWKVKNAAMIPFSIPWYIYSLSFLVKSVT